MKKIWRVLAEGRVIEGGEYDWGDAVGAFVNAVVLAEDAESVEKLTAKWLKEADLELIELEDFEIIHDGDRLLASDSSDEILILSKQVSEDHPVQFDEFQAYLSEHDEQ